MGLNQRSHDIAVYKQQHRVFLCNSSLSWRSDIHKEKSKAHTDLASLEGSKSGRERDLKVIHTGMTTKFMNEMNKTTFREIWCSTRSKYEARKILHKSKEKEIQKEVTFSQGYFQGEGKTKSTVALWVNSN